MDNQAEVKPNFAYYIFACAIVLALAAVSLIPAAMAYNTRILAGTNLPAWLIEAVSIVILFAPTAAILATGFTRVFAVTDAIHAQALTYAAVLEGIACGCEICASLIAPDDWLGRVGRMIFLAGATGSVFAALVLTLSRNGFYKLTIAKNEARLLWHQEFSTLLKQEMRTDDARAEMRRAIILNIQDATEKQAGRQLYRHGTFTPSEGLPARVLHVETEDFLAETPNAEMVKANGHSKRK